MAKYVTTIVLVHLLVNIAHGAAHRELMILLDPVGTLFVMVVIVAGPLVAMALAWSSRKRLGLGLLTLSMAGALVFGFYKHFVQMSSDHVGMQPPGAWSTVFAVTSYLLAITEALGTYSGVYYLTK